MILAAVGLTLFVALLYGLLVAYPAMLLFGAVHSFLPVVPAFGFWQTVAVVLLTHILFSGISTKS